MNSLEFTDAGSFLLDKENLYSVSEMMVHHDNLL